MSYTERKTCRVCGAPLQNVASFGEIFVVNFGDKPPLKAPLTLAKCRNCHLLQLRHTVDPEYLFRSYYYKSGVNQTMRDHLVGVVRDVERRAELKKGDVVVDVGANDGTMLAAYPDWVTTVAFEPATNFVKDLKKIADVTVGDFFSAEAYNTFVDRKAKVITAISMFYDLDDPNAFLQGCREVLADDGLLVIQQNYLPTMLAKNAVDNVVHEHLEYYGVNSLRYALEKNGLKLVDVQFNSLNGGSFRAYVKHAGYPEVSQEVIRAQSRELNENLESPKTYQRFAERVADNGRRLKKFIISESVEKQKSVYVYGASTRGNTLLQVYHLDWQQISFAVDRNPAKWGKKTVGTDIPIISEEEARKKNPAYFLVLPWHFAGEFIEREYDYLVGGGRFILPLPEPYVLPFLRIS